MQCKEIVQEIEKVYPRSAALSFDNVGLQAGRGNREVKKIMLALDATGDVVESAINAGVDMLITHHPLIFSPLKSVTDDDFISKRILRLIQHDICYYAMHTNYDVLRMAELSEQILGITDTEVLDVTGETDGVLRGIGRIGSLPKEMSLEACCKFVKERLRLPQVKVFGNPETSVRRMATSPGSGKSAIRPAVEKGADVLVTGDIGHHEGLDALEQQLCVIDAGHYGTEYIFVEDMKGFIEKKFPDMHVLTQEISHPFQVI